jgi:hypothetical protein
MTMANNRPRSRRATTRRTTNIAPTAAIAVEPETRPAQAVDWRTEYAYVLRDLRQLAIVSATIFALLLIAGWLM